METEAKNTTVILEDKLLTVKEAAEFIKESPGVVRNWLRELKALIPIVIGENGYRYFPSEGLQMLAQVKELRNDKQMSLKQIEDELSNPTVTSTSSVNDDTDKILHELTSLKEALELQKNFNQVLVQQIKKQQNQMESQNKQISDQKQYIAKLEYNSRQATLELQREEEEYRKELQLRKHKKINFLKFLSYR